MSSFIAHKERETNMDYEQFKTIMSELKPIKKLIRKQKCTSFRIGVLTIAVIALAIKFEERACAQDLKIDRMGRELEELKREKGVRFRR